MNIVVCIKRVPDTATHIKIAQNQRSIDTRDVSYVLNPHDEYAIEQALQTRDQAGESKVTAIGVGPREATETIRGALTLGVNEGVLLKTDRTDLDSHAVAAILVDTLKQMPFDLLLFGKQGVDNDAAQVGPLVAYKLGIPCVTFINRFVLKGNRVRVHRQIEGGEEVIEVTLPAAFTTQKGLNEPRYASLRDIMKAKRATITEQEVSPPKPKVEVVNLALPPPRPPGRIVGEGPAAVAELVRLLREEAKIL